VAVVNGLAVKVLSSESFQTLWARANERAHTQFVNVLTGKGSKTITTNNGQVAVDLGAAVTQVQQRLDGLGINMFSGADAKRASPPRARRGQGNRTFLI
jgi:3-deoxy-D-manno-octulosonate 8-phosphate phosphatase KdsC-like HAD superfamily phosphatase